MPLVTVVIPTCNRAALLPAAVASALGQTFRDLEVVVVDDASSDGAGEALRRFDDVRLRYIRHDSGRGGGAARNTAIRASESPYVAFLDDDDEWLPEKVERQLALFRSAGPRVGVVYTGYFVVERATGRVIGRKAPCRRGDLSEALLAGNCVGGASSVVVRRDCLERSGLFDESLPSFQDYDLWLRLSSVCQFDYIEDYLLNYTTHGRKIWSDPTALDRGMQIMLRKYNRSVSIRKTMSTYYLAIGVDHCREGRTASARNALVKAIRLHPFEIRNYFNLALTFAGTRLFRKVKAARERHALPRSQESRGLNV